MTCLLNAFQFSRSTPQNSVIVIFFQYFKGLPLLHGSVTLGKFQLDYNYSVLKLVCLLGV